MPDGALSRHRFIPATTGGLLCVMAGVYTVQSAMGALMFQGMPTFMRANDAALDLIGLISLCMIPWALKFLWAPAVERWRTGEAHIYRSRLIIFTGQAVMAALLFCLAFLSPADQTHLIFALFGLIAVIAATVDIAGDGYMIERLRRGAHGWANVVQIGGGYAGMIIGSGLFLVLTEYVGWLWSIAALASACLALSFPSAFAPRLGDTRPAKDDQRPALKNALGRREVRLGLTIILISQLGIRLTMVITGPLLIDAGVSPALLGMLMGTAGACFSLVAIFGTGFLIRRFGRHRILIAFLMAQVPIYGAFTVASSGALPVISVLALFLAKTAIMAGAFVALYTTITGWASRRQAGVDFSLFQCADAIISVFAGIAGGVIAEHLGYAACFGLATGCALFAVLSVPRILQRIETNRT